MISAEFASYFNDYSRLSPLRVRVLQERAQGPVYGYDGALIEFPDVPYGRPDLFVELDRVKYARFYRILEEECAYRGVEFPKLFLDVEHTVSPGFAFPGLYAISFWPAELELETDESLRFWLAHELKHLYQGEAQNPQEQRAAELDADRAGVESAGYEAGLPVLLNILGRHIKNRIQFGPLRFVFRNLYELSPRTFAEHYYLATNPGYPSLAWRLREMRKHELALHSEGPC